MKRRTVLLLLISPVLLTCQEASSVGPTESGWLTASVIGGALSEYQGSGWFSVGSDFRQDVSIYFTVDSDNRGTQPIEAYQGLQLYRVGRGRPSVGKYALGALDQSEGGLRGFTAYYFRRVEQYTEAYAARSGEVEITISSGDRVEGRFSFTAARYCPISDEQPWCELPNTIIPDAPTIVVSGSFMAVHVDETPVGAPD